MESFFMNIDIICFLISRPTTVIIKVTDVRLSATLWGLKLVSI